MLQYFWYIIKIAYLNRANILEKTVWILHQILKLYDMFSFTLFSLIESKWPELWENSSLVTKPDFRLWYTMESL